MIRKFASALLAIGLSSIGTPASAEPWIHEPNYDQNTASFTVTEYHGIGQGSKIIREDMAKPGEGMFSLSELNYCTEIGEYCTAKILGNKQWWTSEKFPSVMSANLVMGVCTSKAQDFCIETVRIYHESEKPVAATLIREVDNQKTKAFPKYKLPAGGSTSLWKAASTNESLKDTEVSAFVFASFRNSNRGMQIENFSAVITPYTVETGDYERAGLKAVEKTDRIRSGFNEVRIPSKCAWTETGICGKVVDFPAGARYGITFRINKNVVQLFDGRLSNPEMSVSKLSGDRRRISVDGAPVTVSALSFSLPTSDPRVKELTNTGQNWAGQRNQDAFWFEDSVPWVQAGVDILNDTAPGVRMWWRLTAQKQLTGCWNRQGELVGLVTSNATIYSGGVPKMKSGFLNYSVGGMHYLPDGVTPATGSYDLILRSDVARCLYKISKAPVSATVQVLGESEEVATTTLGEKNGWIRLSAKGFTFSTKTIKVKLRNR